jgi:hypothetical protein
MAKRKASWKALSLKELDDLRSRRLKEIAALEKQRAKLKERIDAINARLASLRGRRRGRPPARSAAAGTTGRRRRRAKNVQPLRDVLVAALEKAAKPLSTNELLEAVKRSGYKSRSKNLRAVIYQAIHKADEIVPAKNGGGYMLTRRSNGK